VRRYEKDAEGVLHKVDYLPSPHALRRTFASACKKAGIDMYRIKVLMNHALPSDSVTEDYISTDDEALREAVEQVATFLRTRKRAAKAAKGKKSAA
jgi:site-specific recombinase XerD